MLSKLLPGMDNLKMVTQDKKKGEDIMRKYKENGQLDAVCCNMCGKKMVVKEGILREGAARFDYVWDYFSEWQTSRL